MLRCLENLPGIGHLVAAGYGCAKNKDKAERAGIKATVGIILFAFNFPAEVVDELGRKVSWKLRSRGLTTRANWMRHHRGKILRNMCLPGSHQSATYHMHRKLRAVPMVEGWSRCQKLSIDLQLYGGIRFLDLRLMNDGADIWCHHNLVTCVKLRKVLECVRDFINENKSEIVFLYMTNDGKNLEWPTVNAHVNEYLSGRLIMEHQRDMLIGKSKSISLFYPPSKNIDSEKFCLESAYTSHLLYFNFTGDLIDQGKQVAVFGVPHVAYTWNKLRWRWPNKAWPKELQDDFEDSLSEMSMYPPGNNLFWYKAECTPNAAMVTRCVGGVPGLGAGRVGMRCVLACGWQDTAHSKNTPRTTPSLTVESMP